MRLPIAGAGPRGTQTSVAGFGATDIKYANEGSHPSSCEERGIKLDWPGRIAALVLAQGFYAQSSRSDELSSVDPIR
jgi:hypothetical protein